MKNALLRELLDVGESFEQQHVESEQTLHNFSLYLSQQLTGHPDISSQAEPTRPDADVLPMPGVEMAPSLLAQYISMTYRYVRHYVRKALAATPLITFDDFICLVILLKTGSLTKTELIEATINEKPSGLLVIKRLLDAGFVQQVTDQTDRRSKRISLTPAGRWTVLDVMPAMDQAARLVADAFTPTEQMQFLQYLMRFDQYHKPRFLGDK